MLKPESMSSPVTTIADIGRHDGQSVTIRGWLYNLRESGKLLFPQFRDGSGIIQGIVPKNAVTPEVFDAIKTLTQESSVIVEGKVRADKRAPGGYELDVANVQVVQRVPESTPYPITPKEHGTDFLMEHRHLWVRSQRQAAILRVRAEIIKAARDFFDERGFTLTDPPIITPAACEGTSTLFPVDYFDEQAFLTQSGQLYVEATAMALGKVYSFGPTFRAEKSKTRRHLTEFWMVEPEVAYATLDDVMELAEGLITSIVKRCVERRRTDLQTIGRDISKLEKIEAPFPRISYDDAVKNLQEGHAKGALESNFEWGGDLGSPGRNVSLSAVRQASHGASLSGQGESLLYGARSRSVLTSPSVSMCSLPKAMEKSSEARSAWLRTNCSCSAFTSTACPKKPSSGISTCANSAAFRTAASAWASSARSRGSAAWNTCEKRFRSRECCTGFIRKMSRLGDREVE